MPVPLQAPDDVPTYDPDVVDRAYHLHRARRAARLERKRARRYAHLRFFVVVALLVAGSVFLSVTIWREIERLFGL